MRHLLLHRSGLPEYHALRLVAGAGVDDRLEHADVLRLVDGMSPWFTPGTRVSYTNTNYAMLAHVVAAATGTPFAAAVSDLVFRPAGMAGAAADCFGASAAGWRCGAAGSVARGHAGAALAAMEASSTVAGVRPSARAVRVMRPGRGVLRTATRFTPASRSRNGWLMESSLPLL